MPVTPGRSGRRQRRQKSRGRKPSDADLSQLVRLTGQVYVARLGESIASAPSAHSKVPFIPSHGHPFSAGSALRDATVPDVIGLADTIRRLLIRPTWVEVDLDAIEHNVKTVKRWLGGVRLIGALKGDACGFGT